MNTKNASKTPFHDHVPVRHAVHPQGPPPPLPRRVRERIDAVAKRERVKPSVVEQELRQRLLENAERTRAEEAERAAKTASGADGGVPGESVPGTGGIRRRRKVVAEIRVKLDAGDARVAKALMVAYGLPASHLVRMLLRTEFAAVHGKESLFPGLEPPPEK
jgi:hypothetical protein